jgi:hypothetical protein
MKITQSGLPIGDELASGQASSITVTVTDNNEDSPVLMDGEEYQLQLNIAQTGSDALGAMRYNSTANNQTFSVAVTDENALTVGDQGTEETIRVYLDYPASLQHLFGERICEFGSYKIVVKNYSCEIGIGIVSDPTPESPVCLDNQTSGGVLSIYGTVWDQGQPYQGEVRFIYDRGEFDDRINTNASGEFYFEKRATDFKAGKSEVAIGVNPGTGTWLGTWDISQYVEVCSNIIETPSICTDNSLTEREPIQGRAGTLLQAVTIKPQTCAGDTGIVTAIGCVRTEPTAFIEWLFRTALGLAGGIAFIIMATGAFIFMTSQGNPEQINKGKDLLVSAIAGLLFIVFAVFLLRFIGVGVLGIPGFE